jgi:hypothetical protein
MNKLVRFDNAHDLKVTGVIKDVPANASLVLNILFQALIVMLLIRK